MRNPGHRSEHGEQCAVFDWAAQNEHKYPELKYLFATLNGVKMSIGMAMKCKRAGMKKGPLDIYLLEPKGNSHGLIIEMKIPGNYPTKEQKEWIARHNANGYCATVCVGADQAIIVLKTYLEQ